MEEPTLSRRSLFAQFLQTIAACACLPIIGKVTRAKTFNEPIIRPSLIRPHGGAWDDRASMVPQDLKYSKSTYGVFDTQFCAPDDLKYFQNRPKGKREEYATYDHGEIERTNPGVL